MERKADLRKGLVRKDVSIADGAGMDVAAEDILFSVALPEDKNQLRGTLTQATDNAENKSEL